MSWAAAFEQHGPQSPAHAAVLLTHMLQVRMHAAWAALAQCNSPPVGALRQPEGPSSQACLPPPLGLQFADPCLMYGELTAALQAGWLSLLPCRSQGGQRGRQPQGLGLHAIISAPLHPPA